MENLKSLADRTTEEQREIASKGGKASVEARREKKRFKELLELALSLKNEKTGNTNDYDITISMINKAIKGSERAFELIRDTIGEKPVDKVENINPPIAPLVISDKEKEDLNNFIVNSIKQNREENNND